MNSDWMTWRWMFTEDRTSDGAAGESARAREFTLLLRGNLKELARPGSAASGHDALRLPARPGLCVRDYLVEAGLMPDLVMAVLMGGRSVGKDYQPAAGDEIVLLAPLSGG